MNRVFIDKITGLYNQDHIGVDTFLNVLSVEELYHLGGVFKTNTERFKSLDFGGVTRWDLTEEDLFKYSELEIGRKKSRTIADTVIAIAEGNKLYREKFSVLFYPKGSSGVKPHRDTEHSVNCIVILVIKGVNSFYVAKDKTLEDVTEFSTKPGDAIVLRGPRSSEDTLSRPIHYVDQVVEPRYVMIYRHINLDGINNK